MDLVLKEGLLIQKVVDEVVILEPDSGDYYTLNEIGALMLEQLQQGKSADAITLEISQTFNVTQKEVKQDFTLLLTELEKHGLAHHQAT
ncbi:PqqD family protein [uncultured Paraglaciecola sp.]|uniref:PqqD family protein n=1 Tax=uncultured Paraglaciecola sp. TaxID=1765024 RepID=UPI0030DA69F7|tara:strand:- start:523 stop:789 length:267 start_codon:yes stop_codon:yes gene_type:complete